MSIEIIYTDEEWVDSTDYFPEKHIMLRYDTGISWDTLLKSIIDNLNALGYHVDIAWQDELKDAIEGVADDKLRSHGLLR